MALSKKPVNGMKDILPEEMQIRDYVQQVIKETYRNFGFTQIETPCMENIANLSSKQGGENEKLIFKVMKRGEKLKIAEAKDETDLVDFGMRYDLTVPLVRYYSNNANDLPSPFKALQMGNVWRADRPQRGRYRQFMQCDIDIIGEPSNLAEIELILATTTTIGKLGFKNFEIRINERRILKAMAAYSGFAEEDYDTVFIILDKMDKIGLDGVAEELAKEAEEKTAAVRKYLLDEKTGLFVSGEEKQINYASQVWLILAGAVSIEEGSAMLDKLDELKPEKGMVSPYMNHHYVEALLMCGKKDQAMEYMKYYWGGMISHGADTFWELYNPENPAESPYGSSIVNSYCHAWSCTPTYLLRKYFN